MLTLALALAGAADVAGTTFSDATAAAGINYADGHVPPHPFTIPTLEFLSGGAAAGDYDNDGWVDLYVTRYYAPDILYRNNGNGTFSDATVRRFGTLPTRNTNGAGWGDIDNDGDLDLYVSSTGQLQHFLYVNDGAGHFTEEARRARRGGRRRRANNRRHERLVWRLRQRRLARHIRRRVAEQRERSRPGPTAAKPGACESGAL